MDRDLGGALRLLTETVKSAAGGLGSWGSRPAVLCLSGGGDSSALALAFAPLAGAWPGGVAAAHVAHALRGGESAGDAEAVREICARLGIALRVLDAAVLPGPNLEARAREARYGALRRAFPDALLCTAHHRDDQAETVMLRLLRGAGPRGLGGIARLRDDGIWRPFLGLSRSDLDRACREAGWVPRMDSSNGDRSFLRNRLRLDVLPEWEASEPGIVPALASLGDAAQAAAPWIERALDRLGTAIDLRIDADGFSLDLSAWDRSRGAPGDDPELDLLLERTWTRMGRRPWSAEHRRGLLEDCLGGGGRRRGGQAERASFGGGRLRVEAERDQLSRSFL